MWMKALCCSLALASCGTGQIPFKQVQFCLSSQHDAETFKSVMRKFSEKENLRYSDRSQEAESELKSLEVLEDSFPLVLISGESEEFGYGFGAGNAGLPADQISIGFRSPETDQASAFASRAVAELEQYWEVLDVPDHRGALPIACAESRSSYRHPDLIRGPDT